MHVSTDWIRMKTWNAHTIGIQLAVCCGKSSDAFGVPMWLQVFEPWCGNIDDSAMHEYSGSCKWEWVLCSCACELANECIYIYVCVCVSIVHVRCVSCHEAEYAFRCGIFILPFSTLNTTLSVCVFSSASSSSSTHTHKCRLPCDVCIFQCSCPKDI